MILIEDSCINNFEFQKKFCKKRYENYRKKKMKTAKNAKITEKNFYFKSTFFSRRKFFRQKLAKELLQYNYFVKVPLLIFGQKILGI